jgi:hypothetical protein
MRWGLLLGLIAIALMLPGAVGADEPVYEDAPVYEPAPGLAKIRFAGLRLNRRSGTAILFVRVFESGQVILHGRGIRRLVRSAPQAKLVRLPVKPKVRLRRYLKRHGKGRIRPLVTLKPQAGTLPKTIERVIVLRRRRH